MFASKIFSLFLPRETAADSLKRFLGEGVLASAHILTNNPTRGDRQAHDSPFSHLNLGD